MKTPFTNWLRVVELKKAESKERKPFFDVGMMNLKS
jgi:hypothetical protein